MVPAPWAQPGRAGELGQGLRRVVPTTHETVLFAGVRCPGLGRLLKCCHSRGSRPWGLDSPRSGLKRVHVLVGPTSCTFLYPLWWGRAAGPAVV